MLFEVRQEGRIGEMLQARRIVRHDIDFSREIRDLVTIPVLPLVHASEVAQESRWAGAGDSPFVGS